jgi:hypothetical protein
MPANDRLNGHDRTTMSCSLISGPPRANGSAQPQAGQIPAVSPEPRGTPHDEQAPGT